MLKKLCLILVSSFILTSCATKLNPESDKAFLDQGNENIVWNQEIFEPSFFTRSYEVDQMFLDDEEAQNSLKEVNKTARTAGTTYWSLLGGAILYSLSVDRSDRNDTVYYGLLIGAVASSVYLHGKKNEKTIDLIDKYNKKKNYVIFPSIYKTEDNGNLSLNFAIAY